MYLQAGPITFGPGIYSGYSTIPEERARDNGGCPCGLNQPGLNFGVSDCRWPAIPAMRISCGIFPIGYGTETLGQPRTVPRQVRADYRTTYPGAGTVPDIIEIGLMIDSNTVGGTAESALFRI